MEHSAPRSEQSPASRCKRNLSNGLSNLHARALVRPDARRVARLPRLNVCRLAERKEMRVRRSPLQPMRRQSRSQKCSTAALREMRPSGWADRRCWA
eukprot:6194042-Pleurochrysis_carterae.AAC.4